MASAVDKQPAAARLAAVAAARCLPTATRGSQNSYTTSGDTTNIPWSDIPKGQRHSLIRLYDIMPAQHKDWLEIKYRATKRGLPEGLAFLGFVNRSPDAPGPEYSAPSREVYRLRGLFEYLDENAKLWKTRYSWESMLENNWRYYLNDISVLSELIDRVLSEIPRDNPVLKLESATRVTRK